jgi:hypothetical protein
VTRAGSLRRLPLAVLVGAGAFGLHDLRYVVVYRHEAGEVLALREHAYLPLLTPLVAVALVLLLRHLVVTRRASISLPRVWAAVSAVMLAVYAAQELAEGALAADHPMGMHAIVGHGGWTAVALSVVLGLLVALALRGVDAATSAPVAAAPRVVLQRVPVVATLTVSRPRVPLDPIAHFLAGRGPPPASV